MVTQIVETLLLYWKPKSHSQSHCII